MGMSNKIPLLGDVQSLRYLTPTTFLISFKTDRIVEFEAGQFVSVIVPGAGPQGRDLRRAYSIASSPESELLSLCVKKVEGGPGTTYLSTRKPGDQVKLYAPFGDFVLKSGETRRPCMIATGTGVSPFLSIVQSSAFKLRKGPKPICIFGTVTQEEMLFEKEFSEATDVDWVACVSRQPETQKYFSGRVTHYLKANASSLIDGHTDYYLCGNGAMIAEVKQILAEHGVAKESIFQEKYY